MTHLCEEICIFHFNSVISCGLKGRNILVILYSQYPVKLKGNLTHFFSSSYSSCFMFSLQLENFPPTRAHLSHLSNSVPEQSSLSG